MLGRGKTAEVYELGPDKVVKLFYQCTGESLNKYELDIGQAVYEAGVPSPEVYEEVQIMGRNGIIMERAAGNSMFTDIERRPWAIARYGKTMARLHAKIHSCRCEKLASQYDVIKSKIGVSAQVLGERAHVIVDYLSALPDGVSICHGDFHPKNIIGGSNGYMTIDWPEVYYGNCAGDVARTALILSSPHVPAGTGLFFRLILKQLRRLLLHYYLDEYLRLTNVSRSDINRWVLPVAAARLKEEISEEWDWLMNIIEGRTELLF